MEKSTVAARVNAMLKYGILQEVGEIKIEKEAKRLKAEGKTLDDFSEEEIVNRYIDWTVWGVIQLKKYMRGEKDV